MLERTGWSAAALAMALAITWTGTAKAEPGILVAEPGGGYSCSALPTPGDCTVDAACTSVSGPGTCRMLFTQRFCIPNNSFGICCGGTTDCPLVTGATATCVSSTIADTGICVEVGRSYCDDTGAYDPVFTRRCHTSPDGAPVRWALGDCDGDGVTNADEITDGTDVCIAPQPRGIWDGSACLHQTTGCDTGSSCDATGSGPSGTCMAADDGNGRRCVPSEEVLYCADGSLECAPELMEVIDSMRGGHVWCISPTCAGIAGIDLLDCVIKAGEPVVFSEGDCDRDGTRNGDDESLCGADTPLPDAGLPGDGGNTAFDAGIIPGTDGGTGPSFEGGGGCACRASTGSRSGPAGAIVSLLAIALVLARRKR